MFNRIFMATFVCSLLCICVSMQYINVALHRPANQSSIHNQGYEASLAVDGNEDNMEKIINKCQHTKSDDDNAKWTVNLGNRLAINHIIIIHRNSSKFLYRFENFKLYISNGTDCKGHLCHDQNGTVPTDARFEITCSFVGQYVTICNGNLELHVCEVEVFGCPYHRYGNNCSNQCNCINSTCDLDDGECHYGCERGYRESRCDQSCLEGSYGLDCNQTCGKCFEEDVCDNITGQCPGGCEVGYREEGCDEKCELGRYGENCTRMCNQCKDKVCDHIDGQCEEGCEKPGFASDNCLSSCSEGQYGLNCNKTCGNCFGEDVCEHVNGHCPNGCKDGYREDRCDEKCELGRYGANCTHECSQCKDNVCHHINGQCEEGCEQPGFALDNCRSPCLKGQYGFNCNQTCGNCEDDACDTVTGNCSNGCKEGYHETGCQICSNTTYGKDCLLTCVNCKGGVCRNTDGACTLGCLPGYRGGTCREVDSGENSGNNYGLIAGVVLCVLLLIIIAIVLFFLIRHRRKKTNPANVAKKTKMKFKNRKHIDGTTEDSGSDVALYMNSSCEERKSTELKETQPEEDYYNVSHTCRGVAVRDLRAYIDKKNGSMEGDFGKLPTGAKFPTVEGQKPENKIKNRYLTTFPYDHTRVILEQVSKDSSSDYINANYIDSLDTSKAYIAAQGPTNVTLVDFWWMMWQEKTEVIVMLTNPMEGGKVKCQQYWPSDSKDCYGDIFVQLQSVKEYNSFVIRELLVSNKKSEDKRKLMLFHFTAWPDHGVAIPLKLAFFHRIVLKHKLRTPAPIMVHCSAGIGRTGTFIALHALYTYGLKNQRIDIDGYIFKMRSNRMNMIQTVKQYSLLHECLHEAFTYPDSITSNHTFVKEWKSMLTPGTQGSRIETEFKIIETMKPVYNGEMDLKTALDPENKSKNRKSDILPVEKYRTLLCSPEDGCNDYINAVIVPSFEQLNGFLVTQLPLTNTAIDFWRMVIEYRPEAIVLLNTAQDDQVFVPTASTTLSFGPISVKSGDIDLMSSDISSQHCVLSYKSKHQCEVNVFTLKTWQSNQMPPPSVSVILEMVDVVTRSVQGRQSRTTVVVCCDGATCCGLYCAVANAVEQLRMDSEVDVYQTVRELQIVRPEFIPTIAQYRLVYEAANDFSESSDIYANV